MDAPIFRDRREAGELLGRSVLTSFPGISPIVIGLPRGGVVVADAVARQLGAPLDVFVVRKVTPADNPEYAVGAVAEDGVEYIDHDAVDAAGLDLDAVDKAVETAQSELARRIGRFVADRTRPVIRGKDVVIVDDGLATGATARVAVMLARERGARRIILAVPVAAASSIRSFAADVHGICTLTAPTDLVAIGDYYDDFRQVDDHEVVEILAERSVLPGR